MDDLVADYPGALGQLPQLPDDSPEPIGNLVPTFNPTAVNLNSLPTMDDGPTLDDLYNEGQLTDSTDTGFSLGSLQSFLQQGSSSLLGAFVTNPANAATQEQQATTSASLEASLSQLQTSQVFSYLFVGAIIFLIYNVVSSHK